MLRSCLFMIQCGQVELDANYHFTLGFLASFAECIPPQCEVEECQGASQYDVKVYFQRSPCNIVLFSYSVLVLSFTFVLFQLKNLVVEETLMRLSLQHNLNPQFKHRSQHTAGAPNQTWTEESNHAILPWQCLPILSNSDSWVSLLSQIAQAWAKTEAALHRALGSYILTRNQRNPCSRSRLLSLGRRGIWVKCSLWKSTNMINILINYYPAHYSAHFSSVEMRREGLGLSCKVWKLHSTISKKTIPH